MTSPRMFESRAKRRRGERKTLPSSSPSILVASFLIVNAVESCHAVPRPVQTAHPRKRDWSGGVSFAEIDDQLPDLFLQHNAGPAVDGLRQRRARQQPVSTELVRRDILFPPTQTLERRSYTIATASGKSIIVPSGFASVIASSWDPGSRSIWFQRKAVIICAIFLAIFIVLIIGAAVFLRDKREEDAEEEVDVSDEAALKRMREEREMRKGGRGEKRREKKRREKQALANGGDMDSPRGKEGGGGATTGFKWAKVPIRRMRNRKSGTPSQKSRSSQSGADEDGSTNETREISLSGAASQSRDGDMQGSARASQTSDVVDATQDGSLISSTEPTSGVSEGTDVRTTLTVADVTAAEEAEQQQQQHSLTDDGTDAFPPAYIPNHQRLHSRSQGELHPSADRPLRAGPASSTVGSGTPSDEKSRADLGDSPTDGIAESALSSLPSGSGNILQSASSTSADVEFSAHIATDDKDMLGRLRNAASHPSAPTQDRNFAAPSYDFTSSTPASSLIQQQVNSTAPDLGASAPLEEDVNEHEWEEIEEESQGEMKGKGASSSSALLPEPPKPISNSVFSQFDMPYTHPSSSLPSQPGKSTVNDKAREAEEEQRKAMALMESRPEDMNSLPLYEDRTQATAPSAPPGMDEEEEEEEEKEEGKERRLEGEQQESAPSAPPLEGTGEGSGDHSD